MVRRRGRYLSVWALAAAVTTPLLGAACGDGETDGPSEDSNGGQGGTANDGATGGQGDAGSGSGGRLGASGGREGSGGGTELPDCLEPQVDASCSVTTATAAATWHCTLRFPTDLRAEDGAAAQVFVACEEQEGSMGGAGGGAPLWTFDHRSDTLRLGRALCESLDEGVLVTAVAGCSGP